MQKNVITLIALVISTIGASAQPARSAILFEDRFDGQSGRPPGWQAFEVPSTLYWFAFNGEFRTGNADHLTVNDGRNYAVIQVDGASAWSNYTISADAWMSQRNGGFGLVGWWKSPSEHIEGSIEFLEGTRVARIVQVTPGPGGGAAQRFTLGQGDSSATKLPIPDLTGGSSALDAHRLSLSFEGLEITMRLDGQTLLKSRVGMPGGGPAGLMNNKNLAYFDNVLVEGAASVSSAAPAASPTPTMTPVETPTATPEPTPDFTPVATPWPTPASGPAPAVPQMPPFSTPAPAMATPPFAAQPPVSTPRAQVGAAGGLGPAPVGRGARGGGRGRAGAPQAAPLAPAAPDAQAGPSISGMPRDAAFRIAVGFNMTRQQADDLKRQLGVYGINVGAEYGVDPAIQLAIMNLDAAGALQTAWLLQERGFGDYRIVLRINYSASASDKDILTAREALGGYPGTYYRTGLARFDSEEQARQFAAQLTQASLGDVAVVPELGKFAVYAGRFESVEMAFSRASMWRQQGLISQPAWVQNAVVGLE